MTESVRIAVIDDHPLYRDGVVGALQRSSTLRIVGLGACADDALRIAHDDNPNIVLLAASIRGNYLTAGQQILKSHSGVKIVVFTEPKDEDDVAAAMKAGFMGCIVRAVTADELVRAVAEIHLGASYVSPCLAARILTRHAMASVKPATPDRMSQLTGREQHVVNQVALGLTNKEVARALGLSEKTVKYHMTNIMQKLPARNRSEVALIATRMRVSNHIGIASGYARPLH